MGRYSDYKLVIKDLPAGKTAYKYEIDDSFFKLINDEESDIKRGKLGVDVVVNYAKSVYEVKFAVNGAVFVPCDRCLDDVSLEVNVEQKLIVKLGKEYSEESDEIVVIPEDEGEVNIAWFIYEFIVLSLPAKRVHPAGQCNREVTQKLKKHRAVMASEKEDDDFDGMEEEDDSEKNIDPRWDALRNLESE